MTTVSHVQGKDAALLIQAGGQVHRDVVYGQGLVGWGAADGPRSRDLLLDVYLPPPGGDRRRPALVMAFGGAFHRGSKDNDSFSAEAGNTSVADYCARFALQGYVAFSIDYRLVPEDPGPGTTAVIAEPDRIPTSRVDLVRQLLGLAPATPAILWRGMEAACDDMATAVRFVHDRAADWQVDPGRIAAGGFSAGARTALNAAFGERVPVAAVVSLSGQVDAQDLVRHLRGRPTAPAVLLFRGDQDLDYVRRGTPEMARILREAGVPCEVACVSGAGHFYRAEAGVLTDDGASIRPSTVQGAIEDFLRAQLPAR